jgi:uncharacterized repeat protein (TIGR03803 family)
MGHDITDLKQLISGNDPDGTDPHAGLIEVSSTLYGTTYGGGANGHGTVFALNL